MLLFRCVNVVAGSTVEEQFEDTPGDMRCYTDADGSVYDFAFGLKY